MAAIFAATWVLNPNALFQSPQQALDTALRKLGNLPNTFRRVATITAAMPDKWGATLMVDGAVDIADLPDIKGAATLNLTFQAKAFGDQDQTLAADVRALGSKIYFSPTTLPPKLFPSAAAVNRFTGRWYAVDLNAALPPALLVQRVTMLANQGAPMKRLISRWVETVADAAVDNHLLHHAVARGAGEVLGAMCDRYEAHFNYRAVPDFLRQCLDRKSVFLSPMIFPTTARERLGRLLSRWETQLPALAARLELNQSHVPDIPVQVWIGRQDGRLRQVQFTLPLTLPKPNLRIGPPTTLNIGIAVAIEYEVPVRVTVPDHALQLTDLERLVRELLSRPMEDGSSGEGDL